jgi:RimJ/RimL family protein N-acetyltransferase
MAADSLPETATLRDGTSVTLRAVRPDDASRLQTAFKRLSRQSVYLRFLDQRTELADREAQRLAGVDQHTHVALAATVIQDGEEHIVGVARYAIISPSEPDAAEAAVTVIDEFQGRGLGTIMLRRMVAFAREHGIRAFVANVHYSNAEIMRFIERSRLPFKKKLQAGVWEIRIALDADPQAP